MHFEPSDLDTFDKRVCSCRECAAWGPPAINWRKKRHPKHAPSVAWRGQWWWRNKHGYYIAWDADTKRLVYLHRRIWETHRGPIPEGFHIHHIDCDKQNNQITNFEPMHGVLHAAHHGIEFGLRQRSLGHKSVCCAQCGTEFVVTKLPSRKKFCSHACALADRRSTRISKARPHPICVCVICSTTFSALRRDAKFCSRKCSAASQDRTEYRRAYYLAHPEKWKGRKRMREERENNSNKRTRVRLDGCGRVST